MSGKGRGRGWLKLEKPLDTPVGNLQNCTNTMDDTTTSSSTSAHPQFEKLLHAVSQFNDNDDGILINRKFKYIKKLLTSEYRNEEVTEVFDYLHNKALQDGNFTAKYLMFITLNSFRELIVYDIQVRRLLINRMENDFNNASTFQENNRNMFHNAVRLLGGFYDKAVMSTNRPYNVFTRPLLCYFNMLLDSSKPDDIELFATQLYLVGGKLLEYGLRTLDFSSKTPRVPLAEILFKVRNLLINSNSLTEASKVWLLLTVDLDNNDYRILSPELLNYYQNKLGDKAMLNLQKSLNLLSVQTIQPSKTLENYSSDVNVLQVDTTTQQVNQLNKQNQSHNTKSPNFNSHKSKDDEMFSTWPSNEGNSQRTPGAKPGRPILGSGARNHNENRWRDQSKENASGWNAKQKSLENFMWSSQVEPAESQRERRNNKGWEHDDRFQTDY